MERDPALDTLLDLDGQVLVIDPETKYWVRFAVRRVPASKAKPHGLDYSLTLPGPDGERLVGFDNAHAVRNRLGAENQAPHSITNTGWVQSVRPYVYQDAATLLADFCSAVDTVLREKGIVP